MEEGPAAKSAATDGSSSPAPFFREYPFSVIVNVAICRESLVKISFNRAKSGESAVSTASDSAMLPTTVFSTEPSAFKVTRMLKLSCGWYISRMISVSKPSATMTPRSKVPLFSSSCAVFAWKARKIFPAPKCTQHGDSFVRVIIASRS